MTILDDVYLLPCGHDVCKPCRNKLKVYCVVCAEYVILQGNQPSGHMNCRYDTDHSLPGHEDCGTIVICFNFDRGIQGIAVQLSLLSMFSLLIYLCFINCISHIMYFNCRSGASQPGGTLLVLFLYRLSPFQCERPQIVQPTEKGV